MAAVNARINGQLKPIRLIYMPRSSRFNYWRPRWWYWKKLEANHTARSSFSSAGTPSRSRRKPCARVVRGAGAHDGREGEDSAVAASAISNLFSRSSFPGDRWRACPPLQACETVLLQIPRYERHSANPTTFSLPSCGEPPANPPLKKAGPSVSRVCHHIANIRARPSFLIRFAKNAARVACFLRHRVSKPVLNNAANGGGHALDA